MKIYLLRHGQAAASYPDHTRELTVKGESDVEALGRFLFRKAVFNPEVVWVSPFTRAQQTANTLLTATGFIETERKTDVRLEPEGDPRKLIADLGQLDANLLIVGHNPHLSNLASLLVAGGSSHCRISMDTSTMICLKWYPLPSYGQMGLCDIEWMLHPETL